MAKIYGTPIMAGGAGGANKDLPPLLDNFKAFKGGGTSENPQITIQADKMATSRANELAGAVWVYGDHEPTSVNDGTKIQLAREEVVTSDGGEAQTVTKTVEWNIESNFFARQFTYNSKKQYQTMLEGAIATITLVGVPDPVSELAEIHSGSSITLTWKNPTSDELYDHTVVVYKTDAFPTSIDDGTQGYSGTGSVSIVTETKTLTPTKSQQVVSATSGKVISSVTVNAIPDNYVDTTDATATAGTILEGETAYVGSVKVEGTMPNNGAAEKTLTTTETSYTIPEGYHNGEGTVIIVPETKTVQPSRSEQNVTPTAGKVLSKVTVGAIPANLIDTTDATAEASDILSGQTAYVNGVKVTGSMVNNAAVNGTIDGLTTTSFSVPAGYTTGGTVSLTNDIETALAAI